MLPFHTIQNIISFPVLSLRRDSSFNNVEEPSQFLQKFLHSQEVTISLRCIIGFLKVSYVLRHLMSTRPDPSRPKRVYKRHLTSDRSVETL